MSSPDKKTEEIACFWTNAQPAVAGFISSVVPRFQDADDVLQQVAIAVVKNYDKYDKSCPFVAWAIGIAKNEILMYRRKNSKGRLILDAETIERISEVHKKESAHFDDIRKALNDCIKKLEGRAKQILMMRYQSEFSISRIAHKLGMTNGAIYTALHRVRLGLQECIKRRMLREDS